MEEELSVKEALNKGVEKHNKGEIKEAEYIYRQILKVDENNSDAWHLLGLIAFQVEKYEDSVRDIKRAIEINSNQAVYYGNLGMVYDKMGDEEESTKNFEIALKIDPEYEKSKFAYYNLGVYYLNKGEVEKALENYDKAIELDSEFYDARWNRALIYLLTGKFKEGWKEYENRFKKEKPSDVRDFGKPKWDGSVLDGKRILVLCEQGFGDSIQFIRYVSLVKEKGGYVVLECKKELKKLFEKLNYIDEIVEKGDGVPVVDYDYYIYLMSLPGIVDFESVSKESYLKADSELVKKYKDKIKSDKFKIGIAWQGNSNQENDKNRSTKFENFKSLNIPDVQLYSLQKGKGVEQIDDSVVDLSDDINDFSDTAAIISNLDLVISVDSSVAHLAGALGKPVWTVLTFMPDWRYMLEKDDCVFYESMKLFRQKKQGDWKDVFEKVREGVVKLVNDK
ncbi:MAG: tetratricopeptide repeat protein [Nanoarchaeota archaeon]|nr:tetratricopeptide repeat protein [Nanoarchaeota archaeon]